jgi:hypothetical protein
MSWKSDGLLGTLDLIKQPQREAGDWHRMTGIMDRVLDAASLNPRRTTCHDVA